MVQKVLKVGHVQYVPKEYKGTQVKLGSQECLVNMEKKEAGVREVKQDKKVCLVAKDLLDHEDQV